MAGLIAGRIEEEDAGRDRISWTRLPLATVLAALAALAGTAVLYFVASAAGFLDGKVRLPSPIGMGPLSLASVSFTALFAIAAAGALLGALAAATNRPVRVFRIAATVLGLGSLLMPATIPGPPVAMRLTMAGMHVVVWAVSVGLLAKLARRRESAT